MHDFIQTSGFTHHYFILAFSAFIFIVGIIIIIAPFITIEYDNLKTPGVIMGVFFIFISMLMMYTTRHPYTEYTGVFKVVDSTTNRVYRESEPSIVVKDKDKHNHEQALPVDDGTVYHKGDIVKVKVYANKGTTPTLSKKIFIEHGTPSDLYNQTLKSVTKVK